MDDQAIREDTGRNPDGTFKKGVSGNPSGRPKNTLKDYVRRKFSLMTDEEKEEFLKKLNPEVIWKMGEGNPAQDTDITTDGQPIPIYAGFSIQGHNSNEEDIQPKETN